MKQIILIITSLHNYSDIFQFNLNIIIIFNIRKKAGDELQLKKYLKSISIAVQDFIQYMS